MTKSLLLQDDEERVAALDLPHLSYSRINRYLHCPEQYRLYYIEKLRPRYPAATLVFGQVVHQGLAHGFNGLGDPVGFFLAIWEEVKGYDLTYKQKESWEKLHDSGQGLIEKFCKEELPRLGKIQAVEKTLDLQISSLDLPFVGIIDLFAEVDGKLTLVDFKTSGSAYEGHELILSDQLTGYHLAEPDAEQSAFCVLVKTKEPKIEWHFAVRSPEATVDFLSKASYVSGEITQERFYKRSGKWCSYCDYLPVCTGNQKKAKETLVQIK
jgi:PD-(D/E)XK nuclease superfamily protein